MHDRSFPARRRQPFDPAAEGRDVRLDAVRGLAQWFIFLDHVPQNVFAWLTLRQYGFSDTTEVFFFVSGYTCALAYGFALDRTGWRATAVRILRRALDIYLAFLLLIVVYLVTILVLSGGAREVTDATNTTVAFADPETALSQALVLRYMPVNTDVLPTFVLTHAAFVPLLWLMRRRPSAALAASLALYALVQVLHWNLPTWPHGEWFFNPFAWQVLVVIGAWMAMGGAQRIANVIRSPLMLALACAYLLFSLIVVLGWEFEPLKRLVPEAVARIIYPIDKSSLDPLRLVHFLALALVVTRLAPQGWRPLRTAFATAIIRCGAYSLPIYCLGVILAFAGGWVLQQTSSSVAIQAVVSAAGIAIMIAAASAMAWLSRRREREPKLF